jgi:hypothetical protein
MHLDGRLTLALLAPVILGAIGWMTYRIGFTVGRAAGYHVCVAEEDDDYPRGDYVSRPRVGRKL